VGVDNEDIDTAPSLFFEASSRATVHPIVMSAKGIYIFDRIKLPLTQILVLYSPLGYVVSSPLSLQSPSEPDAASRPPRHTTRR
jgi:hypothetical protein